MTRDDTGESGRIVQVELQTLGGVLTEDATIGATVLAIDPERVSDFDTGVEVAHYAEDGETLTTLGEVTGFDETASTITIDTPLAAALGEDEFIVPLPLGDEKVAQVVIDGEDAPIVARVPHALYDRLPDGIREPGEEEAVSLRQDSDEDSGSWGVEEVFGKPVVIRGVSIIGNFISTGDAGEPRVFFTEDASGLVTYIAWSAGDSADTPGGLGGESMPGFFSAAFSENNPDLSLPNGHSYLLLTPPQRHGTGPGDAPQWAGGDRRGCTGIFFQSRADEDAPSPDYPRVDIAADLIQHDAAWVQVSDELKVGTDLEVVGDAQIGGTLNVDGNVTLDGGGKVAGADTWHFVGNAGEPAFENGWTEFSTDSVSFKLDALGCVDVAFDLSIPGTGAHLSTIFTLPVGYRPAVEIPSAFAWQQAPGTSPNFAVISTRADGSVVWSNAGNGNGTRCRGSLRVVR